jgi:hypothetical protein
MMALAAWVEASPLALIIGKVPGLYPMISAGHILGIALLLGPILIVDALLIGLARSEALRAAMLPLRKVAIAGFALAAATGLALFSVQATKYVTNPAFLIKLVLIGLAGLNAAFARRLMQSVAIATARTRVLGLASGLLWLGVLVTGRWIGFF